MYGRIWPDNGGRCWRRGVSLGDAGYVSRQNRHRVDRTATAQGFQVGRVDPHGGVVGGVVIVYHAIDHGFQAIGALQIGNRCGIKTGGGIRL